MAMFFVLHTRFARASSQVSDFSNRNKIVTVKILKQAYRYHKLPKTILKFDSRHSDLMSKYNIGLKIQLTLAISNSLISNHRLSRSENLFPA